MRWAALSIVAAIVAGCFAGRGLEEGARSKRAEAAMSEAGFNRELTADEQDDGVIGSFVRAPHAGPFAAALRRRERRRLAAEVESHVSEMIDSVALGMRAGLSFDRAFRLYSTRFDDELARRCRQALLGWETGLVTRGEALRKLSEDLEVAIVDRFVSSVLRSLRYGSPMTQTLEALAAEARAEYRASVEERVAKAPVKMLVPTAVLILPAMLILVMGPVLLDLA